MRPDMNQVLIERPRGGRRLKTRRNNKPRVREFVDEDSYGRELRPSFRKTKHFSDHLGPLRRWLRAQVNRPWDKVWSELCAGIDRRSVSGRHLLDHARWEVTTDCEVGPDRRIYPRFESGRRGEISGLFVHPRTGLLRWQQRREPVRSQADLDREKHSATILTLSDGRFLLKRGGIWFVAVTEVVLHVHRPKTVDWDFEHGYQRHRILGKRQLATLELRHHGLDNDADA